MDGSIGVDGAIPCMARSVTEPTPRRRCGPGCSRRDRPDSPEGVWGGGQSGQKQGQQTATLEGCWSCRWSETSVSPVGALEHPTGPDEGDDQGEPGRWPGVFIRRRPWKVRGTLGCCQPAPALWI